MRAKKPFFNTKQREIIRTLNKTRVGLSSYSISRQTGISWTTVKKHVKKLEHKQIVKVPKINNKKLVRLNFDLIYGKRK